MHTTFRITHQSITQPKQKGKNRRETQKMNNPSPYRKLQIMNKYREKNPPNLQT